MDTTKLNIKTIIKHGRGTIIYINEVEREHIEAAKGEKVILDRRIPGVLRIYNMKHKLTDGEQRIGTFPKQKR